ncbi:hypothetical protein BHE90_017054 [Fusarium euwallaceae]|uniref:Uncharacterized protein n=1 Tax=Fusarium euwallaceae TaxID=1147111 RepID=A0A430KYM7_9HYPO|nr:hypothetical protein BHE90_017054 [Fusarium euwallaceae]
MELYGEVLAPGPFSDVILVFVPDLGFGEVIELPSSIAIQHVHSRLIATFASMLRSSDALKAYTNADLRQRSNEAFHITNVALGSSTLTSEIDKALADSVLRRAGHCLDFKAPHFKHLLQTAIRHHAEQPSGAFDVISASRLPSHPSPDGLRDALGDFLGSRRDVGRTDVALVASALVLDAYPAGAHWFSPGLVFEYFYRDATEHWGRRMGRPEFSQDVKVKFITIATNNRNMKSTVLGGHLMRVQSDWAIQNIMAMASYSLYILRAPHWTLDYKHRFYRECILTRGTLEVPG